MSLGVNTLFRVQTCKRCNEKMKMLHGDFTSVDDEGEKKTYGAILECPKCGMVYRERFSVEVIRKGGTLD